MKIITNDLKNNLFNKSPFFTNDDSLLIASAVIIEKGIKIEKNGYGLSPLVWRDTNKSSKMK